MVAKKSKYHKLAEAHKAVSYGYKKLVKASEAGIEYEFTPKVQKTGFKKR